MEWSNENVLKLIEIYGEKPVLWHAKNPRHFNKFAKHDAWVEIAENMETTIDECKKKMTSLLSSFRREKAKVKKSRGAGMGTEEVYESSWFAYSAFEFLSTRDQPHKTLTTITKEELASINDIEFQEPSPANITSQKRSFPLSEPSQANITRQKRSLPLSESVSGLTKKRRNCEDEMLQQAYTNLNAAASGNDECGSYGSYVGNKLRNYSVKTRNAVQFAISQIIFNADQGQYE